MQTKVGDKKISRI